VIEVAPGLRRWTAYSDEWEEDVGSLAIETDDGLLLIDPIDPPPRTPSARATSFRAAWRPSRPRA
jgi:hypothetical protein